MKPSPPVSTRTMSELFTNKNKSGLTRDLIEALFPMFEEASAGAIAVDRETNITWINSSYSQLLGLVDPVSYLRCACPWELAGEAFARSRCTRTRCFSHPR